MNDYLEVTSNLQTHINIPACTGRRERRGICKAACLEVDLHYAENGALLPRISMLAGVTNKV
jgi:hypothetical protein